MSPPIDPKPNPATLAKKVHISKAATAKNFTLPKYPLELQVLADTLLHQTPTNLSFTIVQLDTLSQCHFFLGDLLLCLVLSLNTPKSF